MEATASDPDVHQQLGMIVGIPDATQVNALATLNIRSEQGLAPSAETSVLYSSDPAHRIPR